MQLDISSKLFKTRLSRKVGFWALMSILVIETLFFVPLVIMHRQVLLNLLGELFLMALGFAMVLTLVIMMIIQLLISKPLFKLHNDLIDLREVAKPRPSESLGSDPQDDEVGDITLIIRQLYAQFFDTITQLRGSKRLYHAIVQQAAEGIYVINRKSQIIDANQQACIDLGYAYEDLITLSVPDIQHHMSLGKFVDLWENESSTLPVTVERVHQRKNGKTFPVEARIGNFKVGGENFLLAFCRDITERKESEKLMVKLAEIGELSTMIIHEVRNPLTTVLMGLNSFKSLDLDERFERRLSLALEEAGRLQRLLQEILLYAKQQKLDLTEIEMNSLIIKTLDLLQENPSIATRKLSVDMTPEPILILGDRDKLHQVFINLISNACEAVIPGETVTWSIESHENTVIIRVQNGGDVIPVDIIPKLTQPFYTTKSSGNGLGLAITNRIVEAHHGTLVITSSVEKGTEVTVSLPMNLSTLRASE